MEESIIYRKFIDVSEEALKEVANTSFKHGVDIKNKYISKILDTNIYTDVFYLFSFSKIIDMFNEYREKYGKPADWDQNTMLYYANENGGVASVHIGQPDVENIENKKTFSASIIMDVTRGVYDINDHLYYTIQFFSVDEISTSPFGNFLGHIKVTTPELACEVLRRLVSCIEGIDVQALVNKIDYFSNELCTTSEYINKLTNILKNS
jgi:hypothetical protein